MYACRESYETGQQMLKTETEFYLRAAAMCGAAILLGLAWAMRSEAAEAAAPLNCHVEWAPMRDGTRLSTRVCLPSDKPERFPVILMRTPYSKQQWPGWADKQMQPFIAQGYAVAMQDVRGTGD